MKGIYQIHNLVNDMIYIGRTKNIIQRRRKHFSMLKSGNHWNKHLQAAFNKYGEENFSFEILEECSESELADREQYYIELYLYNCLWHMTYNKSKYSTGAFCLTSKQVSAIKSNIRGRKFSKEHREKLSVGKRGEKNPFYGTGPTIATNAAKLRHRKRVKQVDLCTNEVINIFKSERSACDAVGVSYGTIGKCCRGIQKTSVGYNWEYC